MALSSTCVTCDEKTFFFSSSLINKTHTSNIYLWPAHGVQAQIRILQISSRTCVCCCCCCDWQRGYRNGHHPSSNFSCLSGYYPTLAMWLLTDDCLHFKKAAVHKSNRLIWPAPKAPHDSRTNFVRGENLALRKLLLLLLKTCCWTRCRSIGGWCVPKNLSRKITTKKALQFTNKSIEILYLIETYKQPRRFQWIFPSLFFSFFLFFSLSRSFQFVDIIA